MPDTRTGLSLLVIAAIMNASFTLPMKFTKKWAWENTWFVWTIFALLILPPLTAYLTIPHLGEVYSQAGWGLVLTVAAFGAGWGVAQVFFGLAVDSIGIALTFSIVLGMSAAIGSIIPLVRLHPEKIFTSAGLTVFAGVILILIGVSVCAVAGRRREAVLGAGPREGKKSFARGLTSAILSGLTASFVNFGLAFGGPLLEAAKNQGAQTMWTPNAAWLPVMVAGAVPNLIYCIYLMNKNRSGGRFAQTGTSSYWLLALVMAFFWFASTLTYGIASGKLGDLGPVLGWPLFMSLIVITASLLGVMTGEWKNSGKVPLRIMMAGVGVLVVAVVVLSRAS